MTPCPRSRPRVASTDLWIFAVASILLLFTYLLSQFSRSEYPLPGARSLAEVASLLFHALFVSPPHEAANKILFNARWTLQRHELEYSVTFVPLLAIGAGLVVGLWRARSSPPSWRFTRWLEASLVVLLLSIPLLLNYYTPAWNATLKQMWLFKNSSTLIRWFCVFIPVVILLASLSLASVLRSPRQSLNRRPDKSLRQRRRRSQHLPQRDLRSAPGGCSTSENPRSPREGSRDRSDPQRGSERPHDWSLTARLL